MKEDDQQDKARKAAELIQASRLRRFLRNQGVRVEVLSDEVQEGMNGIFSVDQGQGVDQEQGRIRLSRTVAMWLAEANPVLKTVIIRAFNYNVYADPDKVAEIFEEIVQQVQQSEIRVEGRGISLLASGHYLLDYIGTRSVGFDENFVTILQIFQRTYNVFISLLKSLNDYELQSLLNDLLRDEQDYFVLRGEEETSRVFSRKINSLRQRMKDKHPKLLLLFYTAHAIRQFIEFLSIIEMNSGRKSGTIVDGGGGNDGRSPVDETRLGQLLDMFDDRNGIYCQAAFNIKQFLTIGLANNPLLGKWGIVTSSPAGLEESGGYPSLRKPLSFWRERDFQLLEELSKKIN